MKEKIFKGVATAIITPFSEDLKIDYTAFEKLLDFQLTSDIDAIVVSGTTGEASTLEENEFYELICFAAEKINKQKPLIAGCGNNSTKKASRLAKLAENAGASALLAVTPYYNKTSQTGLIEYYKEIADSASLPIILYNVPSRTGVDIEVNTYIKLSEIPNIVAVKEASSNIKKAVNLLTALDDRLTVYSGNDELTLPFLSLGADGVISVASNIIPTEMKKIYKSFVSNEFSEAYRLQRSLQGLLDSLFSDINPVPIKTALSKVRLCDEYVRSPLFKMSDNARTELIKNMKSSGLFDFEF